jgi:hypothetical protein
MNEETREIPPAVAAASRRLSSSEDFHALIKWAAEEHGVGKEEFQSNERLGLFESGQRRAFTFLAELVGVNLLLVRGQLRAEKQKETENDETENDTEK